MDGRRLRTQSSRFLVGNVKTTPGAKRSVTFLLPDPSPEESSPIANESFIDDDDEEDEKDNNNNQRLAIGRDRAESTESDTKESSGSSPSENGSSEEETDEGKQVKLLPPVPTPAPKPEKPKTKMIGRYDSFSSRATSIFHIRRGGMPLPNMPSESKEPSEFVYANILRVDDDEEELYEKEKQHSVGEGVNYISEVKYLEQEYKDNLLTSYKTNDLFYFGKDNKPKIGKVNKRVVGCGLFILLIISAIIATIFALVPNTDEDDDVKFDHSMVYVRLGTKNAGDCQYKRSCLSDCERTIERQEGCCIGCPTRQEDTLDDNCNFNVSVGWRLSEFESLSLRQRIYLFASLDGNFFYQTGYAPPIVSKSAEYTLVPTGNLLPNGSAEYEKQIVNSATESTVPNACFGVANQQIILVACLSEYNLFDKTYDGFPAFWCNSFNGSCFNTNNALVEDMDACENGVWLGNKIDSQKEWESDFSSTTKLVKTTDIKKADRPKAEIEKAKSSADKAVVTGLFAIMVGLVLAF